MREGDIPVCFIICEISRIGCVLDDNQIARLGKVVEQDGICWVHLDTPVADIGDTVVGHVPVGIMNIESV